MHPYIKKTLIGGAILLFCSSISEGQQSNFSASSMLSQSSYTQWTGDNGLVSNNITSAIRDRNGFVWITSYNGIMRFDGIQVYVYDENKIPFLSTGAFYVVYEDKSGGLWFSSQSSGIVRYRDGKFERVDPEGKILPKSIRSLKLSDDGTVWVGTNNSGLYKINNEKIERIDCPALNETSILEIAIDSKNNLWLATDGKGLYKYDGSKFENIHGVANNVVNSVCVASDNTVLIGTPLGLDIFKDNRLRHQTALMDFQINKIICDRYDRVWIGSELGLGRFNLKDETTYAYISEKDGFPLSRINFLYFDDENSLWVSTGRDGLVQLRETNIVNITSQQGLTINKINLIYEGPNKTFYIGSDGGSVDVYQFGEVTPLKIQTPIYESGIRDIYLDKEGNTWIASYRGVIKKSKSGEKLYTLKDGLTAVDIRRILPDYKGDLWFASRSGGVMKFHNGKVEASYGKGHGLESNYALALEKDLNGNLYIGTHSGGMSIIHTDGKIETFHIEGNDDGILIFNIHIDNEGRVWAVGNTGLLHFDGKKFKKIILTKSLKGEIFFDWVEDKIGNVWVTGNLGVLKILKSDVNKFLKNEINEVKFKLFDNRDGMKGKECTSATRSLLSSSGRIWVPTISGISVFYPEKTVANTVPPPVYITSLLADDEELDGKGPLEIEPGKLRYTFSYTAPTFISPRKIQFKYKLQNVDAHWINAGTTRQAEYTNLAPGNYIFSVLACNSDGVWSEKSASLSFTVKPFFYQTAYFYLLMTALLLLLFFTIYKWRVNAVERRNTELRKVNDELDRFVYSASHDLRAPLASVLGLVNIARMEKGKNFEIYLEKIETSVLKLDGFIRDIIDFSRNARVEVEPEPIDFKGLISEIFENLKYLDEKDRIKRIVHVEGGGAFYSDKKRLTVVLNNLIANSIRYSSPLAENPYIEVYVKQNAIQVLLQVKDNGIGIGREHIDSIFKMFYRADSKSRGSGIGLYIVKETLEKIQGSISVQSEYGRGSTFTVLLKALKASAVDRSEKEKMKTKTEDLN
ncbi:MAG: GHKL domain-containing protein [Bacteroidetes bacterium]|nr:GHKL domain-containing protein [Bacteroidota bacterium]